MPIKTSVVIIYKIISFSIDLAQNIVVINYATGYDQEGVFVELSQQNVLINAENSSILMTASVDGSKNLYENVKNTLYQCLLNQGCISGTLT